MGRRVVTELKTAVYLSAALERMDERPAVLRWRLLFQLGK